MDGGSDNSGNAHTTANNEAASSTSAYFVNYPSIAPNAGNVASARSETNRSQNIQFTDANGSPPRTGQHLGYVVANETIIERYVTNSFIVYIALHLMVFALVMIAVIGLFDLLHLSGRIDPSAVPQLVTPITIFIGLPFYTLVQITFNNFAAPIDQFARLGMRIMHLTTLFFACVDLRVETHELTATLDECEAILSAMCLFTFRVFNSRAPINLESDVFPLAQQSLVDELKTNRNGEYASEMLETLLSMFIQRARNLEMAHYITESDYNVALDSVAVLQRSLEDVRVGQIVSTPQLFRDFIFTALSMFIFILVPVSLKAAGINNLMLVTCYPFIAFFVWGFPLYKSYVGEPFDDSKRVSTVDYRSVTLEWQTTVRKRRLHATNRRPNRLGINAALPTATLLANRNKVV